MSPLITFSGEERKSDTLFFWSSDSFSFFLPLMDEQLERERNWRGEDYDIFFDSINRHHHLSHSLSFSLSFSLSCSSSHSLSFSLLDFFSLSPPSKETRKYFFSFPNYFSSSSFLSSRTVLKERIRERKKRKEKEK